MTASALLNPLATLARLALALTTAVVLAVAAVDAAQAADSPPLASPPTIEAFVREGCPHCAKAEEFLARLGMEQPALRIVIRDVQKEPAAM